MRAPRCRLCNLEHWGMCANSPSRKAIEATQAAKPAKALKATPPAKPAPKAAAAPAKGKTNGIKAKKVKVKAVKKAGTPAHRPKPTGRPISSISSLEQDAPWIKLGMSRRTYFRRKSAGTLSS